MLTSPSLQADDYSRLRERQLLYLVSVPGETDWLKEVRDRRLCSPRALADPALTTHRTSTARLFPVRCRLTIVPWGRSLTSPRADLQSSVDRLTLDGSQAAPSSTASSSKHPNPAEPHFGLVAKVRNLRSSPTRPC